LIVFFRTAAFAAAALALASGPARAAQDSSTAAADPAAVPGSQLTGPQSPGPQIPGPVRVEVVFVLDTTGSMSGLIDGAKRKIWAIADEIRKANPNAEVRIGLVGYRDRGDAYVTTVTELSSDIHAVYGKLIEFRAQGGGDWPESVNEALNVAVTRLGWTKTADTRRIVFLVGDAPPHMDYVQDIPFSDTLKIAERDGIVVNAVQAGAAADTALAWRTIASLGQGSYIPIPQSGGVVVIETPYDKQIFELQLKLNTTVVPYGSGKVQSEVKGKVQLNAAAAPSAASDIASYGVRSTKQAERKVVTGEGDLVGDIQAGKVEFDKVRPDDLPAELRSLPVPERRAVVETKIRERGALQTELGKLVEQRDAHIAAEKAKRTTPDDGFDEVVQRVIRSQIR
jgi:uncharacterized protein YegL